MKLNIRQKIILCLELLGVLSMVYMVSINDYASAVVLIFIMIVIGVLEYTTTVAITKKVDSSWKYRMKHISLWFEDDVTIISDFSRAKDTILVLNYNEDGVYDTFTLVFRNYTLADAISVEYLNSYLNSLILRYGNISKGEIEVLKDMSKCLKTYDEKYNYIPKVIHCDVFNTKLSYIRTGVNKRNPQVMSLFGGTIPNDVEIKTTIPLVIIYGEYKEGENEAGYY